MKITGKHSPSSRKWLIRQMNDPYVKRAHEDGYRCRATYKLIEIEEKFHLIKNAQYIIDVGAAPGGWSKLLSERSSPTTKIAAIDLLQFSPIDGVKQFFGNFEDKNNQELIMAYLGHKVDLIVSDMAPSTLGQPQIDHLRIMRLVRSVYEFSLKVLAKNGAFVVKIFQGGSERRFIEELKESFTKVRFFKPKSSRSLSVEIYVIAIGFKQCN